MDFPQKPLFSPAPSTGPQLPVVTNSVQTHCSEETNKQTALKSQIFRETFYFRQLFHIGLNLNTRVQVCASCSRCSMPARALSEIKRDRGRWSFPKHCSHPESSGSSFEVVSLQHQPSAGCSQATVLHAHVQEADQTFRHHSLVPEHPGALGLD